MTKEKTRNMKGVMEELRQRSPKLDQRLRESESRRVLAMSLIQMRRKAGLTQKEVAAAMECDQAFISRLESSTGAFPSPKTIASYARACHATAGYIFATIDDGADQIFTVPFGNQDEAEELLHAVQRQVAEN